MEIKYHERHRGNVYELRKKEYYDILRKDEARISFRPRDFTGIGILEGQRFEELLVDGTPTGFMKCFYHTCVNKSLDQNGGFHCSF